MTAQLILHESDADLFITGNTVRAKIVPDEAAFTRIASVIAAVPVPAGNVAVYVTTAPLTAVPAIATLADSEPNAVSPAAAAVEPVPIAICDIAVVVASFMRLAT